MKVAVKDANVLIDLVEGDLLGLWFRLGIETYVPDLVLDEIKHPNHRRMVLAMVEAGNLRVGTFSPAQLSQVDSYKQRYRISLADASAILLAEQMQAILLSGDKLVRKGGLSLDLKVRGLLWVFDELVLRELLGGLMRRCGWSVLSMRAPTYLRSRFKRGCGSGAPREGFSLRCQWIAASKGLKLGLLDSSKRNWRNSGSPCPRKGSVKRRLLFPVGCPKSE